METIAEKTKWCGVVGLSGMRRQGEGALGLENVGETESEEKGLTLRGNKRQV